MSAAPGRPHGPAFPFRGVFPADPHNPPIPPPDAIASELVDHRGRVIAYVWVIKEHHDKALAELQWDYLDQRDPIVSSGASGPKLMD